MPFNQLILPLLGGYIFLIYANCAIYWSSRQSKEQLLFASALLGVLLAALARVIVVFSSKFPLGASLFGLVHSLLDYPGIGTAFLALGISIFLTWLTNKAWPEQQAGFWLYGKGRLNQFESLLYLSFSGVMPLDSQAFRSLHREILARWIGLVPYLGKHLALKEAEKKYWKVVSEIEDGKLQPIPLLLSMKDRKVYVGFLYRMPSLALNSMAYINIAVIKSGYRNKDTLRVTFTDDYSMAFDADSVKGMELPASKVIPICDVVSASLYNSDVFAEFEKQNPSPQPEPN